MDHVQVLTLILGSSLLSAIISSYITKRINDRNNSLKYITEERQKWRSLIKTKTAILVSSTDLKIKKKIAAELQLSLNPYDDDDKKIVDLVNILVMTNDKKKSNELLELTSKLLKHDWERAKLEAKGNFHPLKVAIYTIIVWLLVKKVYYNTNLFNAIRENVLLLDLFTRTCVSIILIVAVLLFIPYIEKRIEEKIFKTENTELHKSYRCCKENFLEFFRLPVRK